MMRIDLKPEGNSSKKQFLKVKDLDNIKQLLVMLASYS